MAILLHFLADYDHHHGNLTIAYKSGMVIEVDDACADRALELGVAEQADEDPIFEPDTDDDDIG